MLAASALVLVAAPESVLGIISMRLKGYRP